MPILSHTVTGYLFALLATASPIVMAAIAHLFLRERLSRFQFFGLCGALCGVIILVSRGRLGTLLGLRFAQGDLWMLLSVFLFAVYSLMLRGLAGALSPVELSFWRWIIAFLAILPFAGRSLLRSLPLVRGSWGKVILMALLGITCFNTFIYQAGHTTDATNMSLLATTSPVVMAAIAHLFLHERLSRFQILGLCGALFGVVVLVSRGKLDTLLVLRFAQGDLWMILSVFLFAVYSLMLRCRPNAFPQKAFLALLIGIGVIGLIPPLVW